MADRYLQFVFTQTLNFTAGTSPPEVINDPNITFDYAYTELVYGTRYLYARPKITVGAKIFKAFASLSNDFLYDLCAKIVPSSAFSDGGHGMVFTPDDMHNALTSESSENVYDEYPAYNGYYNDYNVQFDFRFTSYTTPQTNGSTIITWKVIFVFSDSETDMYNALLALYPNNVSAWSPFPPEPVNKLYIGNSQVDKLYFGDDEIAKIYKGDELVYDTLE